MLRLSLSFAARARGSLAARQAPAVIMGERKGHPRPQREEALQEVLAELDVLGVASASPQPNGASLPRVVPRDSCRYDRALASQHILAGVHLP